MVEDTTMITIEGGALWLRRNIEEPVQLALYPFDVKAVAMTAYEKGRYDGARELRGRVTTFLCDPSLIPKPRA